METRVIRTDPEQFDPELLIPAVECLKNGGIVGLPTETVYGLAVNVDYPGALNRLLELRASPSDKRVTIHVGSAEDAERYARVAPCGVGRRLMSKFWPGPLTIIFPAAEGGDVGIRYPALRVAAAVLRMSKVRVGVPSANRSGEPPARTAQEVLERFGGRIDVVIDAGPSRHGNASTVVRVAGPRPEIVREGAIPRAVLDEVGYYSILFVCTGNTCRSPMAECLFRRALARRLRTDDAGLEALGYRIGSAGTLALEGGRATEHTLHALRELGLDASDHRSRPLSIRLVQDADRVYVMTRQHRETVLEWLPECAEHVRLLDPSGADIEDPIGQDLARYRECARRLVPYVEQRAEEVP
ncbi:MAG: threonylcarbamoyl-AMP synthase [Planctomycetes bacterium]|nr:threonylcarbamoyl-AMP synthase [Planctomycetota bacterium]